MREGGHERGHRHPDGDAVELDTGRGVSSQLKDVAFEPRQRAILFAALVICLACPTAVRAEHVSEADYLAALADMVAEQAPRSALGDPGLASGWAGDD